MLAVALMALSIDCQAQDEPFWLGADISGTTALESRGVQLYNAQGEPRENTALMKELGMNAIRLRVWVDPPGGFSSKEDMLVLAKRAQALGMPVMVDFHYSDSWADPAKQTIPRAWQGMNLRQMCKALARHTRETLRLLKKNHIDVRWVQIGNETTGGMLWEMGRAWPDMTNYALLNNSGYDAVKKVYPHAQCIVHLDCGAVLSRFRDFFNALRDKGGKWDIIGMSVYPYWDLKDQHVHVERETLENAPRNAYYLAMEFGTDVMVVETGYESSRPEEGKAFLTELIRKLRNETEGHCLGVFYWAPEAEEPYPLGAFKNHRPTVIMDALSRGE